MLLASVRVGGTCCFRCRCLQPAAAAAVGESESEGVFHGTERAPGGQEPSPRAADHPERRNHLRRAIVRDAGAL